MQPGQNPRQGGHKEAFAGPSLDLQPSSVRSDDRSGSSKRGPPPSARRDQITGGGRFSLSPLMTTVPTPPAGSLPTKQGQHTLWGLSPQRWSARPVAQIHSSVHPQNYGRPVTILCAARSTVYRAFPGVAIYTRTADAWTARPTGPVIAHPPCRCWSRMRGLSSLTLRARILEMMLAFECLRMVTTHGGVLEQPAFSSFWRHANLPRPGDTSQAPAMWSLAVDQSNWGHRTKNPRGSSSAT